MFIYAVSKSVVKLFLVGCLACASVCAGGRLSSQSANIPRTLAGQRMAEFLRVYNTDDMEILGKFISTHFDKTALEERPVNERATRLLGTHRITRRLIVRRIEQSAAYEVKVLCQSVPTEAWFSVTLKVAVDAPHHILKVEFNFASRPADLSPHRRLDRSGIIKELRAYLARLKAADIFSGVVLLAKDGRPVFNRAYGLKEKNTNVSNRIDTGFSIASLGKMFTSVAIAQLVQKEQLSLDDSVAKLLPDYPNKPVAEKVTIHHLLTHTSGIPDYMDNDQYQSAKKEAGGRLKNLADYFPFFAGKPLLFEPGEKDEYSNSGYIILGAIIEKISGQSFSDYLRENVFTPAGMDRTESRAVSPAGGEISTVEDLLKFDRALRQHKLLTRAFTNSVLATEIVKGTANLYGFEVRHVNGQRIVGHTGGYTSIDAVFDMYLDNGYSVIVLSNYDPPAAQHVKNKLEELITRR